VGKFATPEALKKYPPMETKEYANKELDYIKLKR
jgi:hypothetical protein